VKIDQKHFDPQKGTLAVTRSPDDPTDPRRDAPQAKTRSRSLPMSDRLTDRILRHLIKHRQNVPGAGRHLFLLVAENGRPLSRSGLSKMYTMLRKKVPDLPPDLSSHVLRHSFNENLSDTFDSSGTGDENERKFRNYLNGWSDNSKMAETYNRRRIRKKAGEISVTLQEKLLGRNASDD
jgi:integrase